MRPQKFPTVVDVKKKWGEGLKTPESVAQSKSTHSQKPNLSIIITWIGDCYMLGFTLRVVQSKILCRLDKSPSDETINQGPPMCIHMQKDHIRIFSPC